VRLQSGSVLGELLLSVRYLPTAGRLTVTVLKARHLRATDVAGTTGEKQSWKTSGVKSTKESAVDRSVVIGGEEICTFLTGNSNIAIEEEVDTDRGFSALSCEGQKVGGGQHSDRRDYA